MSKYKTIFFDLDHTLWDFEANSKATLSKIYIDFSLSEYKFDFESFYQCYKGHNERLWDRYRKGFIKRDELKWKRMWLTLLDFKVANELLAREMGQVFMETLPLQTSLFPYTFEVLDYAKAKGLDINLITNGFEDTQWKKIENCNLTPYFSHVITSEKSNSVKPNAEIFEYSLNLAAAERETSLMIGDNYDVDIAGAAAVGIDQVYFNPDVLEHSFLPTFEIKCLSELKGIF